ncbi:peptidase M24, structural domain-containing protein [Radiomyces spectabilis]|uniref:peptidase M24, structural domain-containing protein n=1 Tax=Radiomyces spectabilis TaxID=64574 RepID=UPI00221F3875|nr:peptidase M24, structural domain-containing protein [Radiomyces spectabilis]KAI8374722.1 peptidase M24, structural domain-containing protein [Radiomyces spectabilis]
MSVNTTQRLQALRELMASEKYAVDAFLIPSEDAHQSEYIADCDKRRHWISGFTGSAGFAIVTANEAALFTDGRYFLQASEQLDGNWTLMKQGLPGVPTWQEYLVKNLAAGSRIGLDPTLITAADADQLTEQLKTNGSSLVLLSDNLVDIVWHKERPCSPKNVVNVHSLHFAGKPFQDKLADLRKHISSKDAYGVILSALDEIAWLFNLRGSDVECNPVFFAYALVTEDAATLFIDPVKLSQEVKDHLGADVTVRPYTDVFSDLQALREKLSKKIIIDNKTSLAIETAIGKDLVLQDRSFVTDAKAVKNEAELKGMRDCHLRDGAALVSYFAWLEDQLLKGATLDEVDGADRLEQFRAAQKDFVGLSFDTISSTGANGAIIHYKPEKGSCKVIDPKLIYLCDSGGQYKDGTTDVTRTLHFGEPTEYEKRCFTRVLQGHIAIDVAVFPKGTTGYLLDPFARHALWKDGLDFRHGTGHGVGSYLNVHEGPHGIGVRQAYNDTPLAAGMVVTNEPGYYEDGHFGIRIESVLIVKEASTPHNFGGRGYLGFEHVTMAPLGRKLIDVNLLSPEERKWVNDYHDECWANLSPLLKDDALATAWLKKETLAI